MLINLKIKMFFNYGIKITSFQQNYEPSKFQKFSCCILMMQVLKEFEVIISQGLLKMFEMWNWYLQGGFIVSLCMIVDEQFTSF